MTAAVAHPVTADVAQRPALRLLARPAPHREPPFDDELEPNAPIIGRFDQRLPFPRAHRGPAAFSPAAISRRPIGLPDPAAWARRLLVGLIETADGRRPLQQVAAMLSPSVGRGLGLDFERATTGGAHWLHRAAVLSVRSDEPADGVAELCACLEVGARVRAVALRLEARRGRWQCTRLQLG